LHIALTGERVYVINKGIDGTEPWVSAKRCQHTTDHGDVYVTESWTPDELITPEQFASEHAKDRSELLDALRSHGVMVLNDQPETIPDPHAN
jgi:hypothetical protein